MVYESKCFYFTLFNVGYLKSAMNLKGQYSNLFLLKSPRYAKALYSQWNASEV